MEKIKINSPAKINIGLNVIEKRKDGYHNIETIFYPLLLSDEIVFEKSDKFEIISGSDDFNNIKTNLIKSAINALEELSGEKFNLKINIIKRIPIGAGLGGGSSNAAVTLKAINLLFNLNVEYDKLFNIALKLGSDVPYFLNPQAAFGQLRGEKLTGINFSITYPILIVNPGIDISTEWAFSKISTAKPEISLKHIIDSGTFDFNRMKNEVKNDFEKVVFKEYPVIRMIKEKLYEFGAEFALMTGTGSTVFGIFLNLQKAHIAEEYFKMKNIFTNLNDPIQAGSIT